MSKRNRWGTALEATNETQKLVAIDQESESRAQRYRNKKAFLSVDKIQDRASNTRELDARHVDDLMFSIAKLGLVQSIAVDEKGVLLAGGHRLAAVRKLKDAEPDSYKKWFEDDQIPVIMHEVGAGSEAEHRALAIELSENEKRRDYTADEVKHIVGRMRAAGYKDGRGRLRSNEQHIVPQLALVLGRSLRTARRLLDSEEATPTIPRSGVELALRRCRTAMRQYFVAMKNRNPPPQDTKYRELHELLTQTRSLLEEVSGEEFGQMAELRSASLCEVSEEVIQRVKSEPSEPTLCT